MEITIKRELLLLLLGKVIGAVSLKQNNPIYSHVLVEVEHDGIHITSSNVDLEVTVARAFKSDKQFSFVIPARKTMEILKNLSSDNITITVNVKDSEVIFSSENYKFNIKTLNRNHFKLIGDLKKPIEVKVKAENLRDAIKSTIFVSIENSSMVYASGILFELAEKKLTLVTTDSFRMAMSELPSHIENEGEGKKAKSLLVPRKTAQEIYSLLQGEDGQDVTLEISDTEIAINIKGARLVSKVLDANFPSYAQLLEVNCKEYVIVKKEELSKAIRAVSVLGDKDSPKTSLIIEKDHIEINLKQQDSGAYKINNSDSQISNEFETLFLSRYLIEAIDVLKSSQAKIEFPEQRKTVLIKGYESATDSVHVISLAQE